MQITHRFREIGIVCLLCLLLLFPSSILFFIDGGQIIGINENLEKKQNIVGQTVDNVLVTPAHGVIKPIDDGTEIVSVNLWQLPPRDILIRIITKPMAYIPPHSHICSQLSIWLSVCLCLFSIVKGFRKQNVLRTPAVRLFTRQLLHNLASHNK